MSVSSRGTRPPRPGMRGKPQGDSDLAAMIRVDHAGEFGALRIYEGQLAVLPLRGGADGDVTAIRHMAGQEQTHFATFDQLMQENAIRPTVLEPVWRIAGFALGAGTALLGTKAAMACTAAVEDVIDDHYATQTKTLDGDVSGLRDTIERFRADEQAHRNEALARGAEDAPAYPVLSAAIKLGCRLAIRLSRRF